MANQIKISSSLLDIGNQQRLLEFLNFVNINTDIVKGTFQFMDPKHHEDFLKFKDCFQVLQNLFPNFKIKFKQLNQNYINKSFSQKQDIKTDDESQIISSISSQIYNSQSVQKLNQFQEQPNEIKPNGVLEQSKKTNEQKIIIYQKDESLEDAYQEEDENDESQVNNIRDNQEVEVESFPSLNTQLSQSEIQSINFSDFLESELKNIENQDSRLSISLSSILNQSISVLERTQPNTIIIQGLTSKNIIQVQNDFILPMIQALFLPEWNTLTESLNLSKINAFHYKQKLKQDFYYLKTQILAFVDSVQFIEVQFCYHSQYAMAAESKMNEFLKSIDVLTFQNHDGFFLASRKKTKENLQEIASQILNAYRGGLLYFSNIKPYQTSMDLNRDLAKARHLFFKKYLSQDLKQYSFYQYFNDQYFLYEMNFSKIQENRENAEKSIKKYIEAYCKNLFLIKFSISNNNETNHKLEMILQETLDQNNHLPLILSQSQSLNEFILFGTSQEIQEYVNILLKTEKKNELRFSQMKFEIDTNNFMYQIREDKNKIDLQANLEIMKKYGFEIKESQGRIQTNLIQQSKFNFENLFSIIRYFCQIKTSNHNYQDLLQLYQQFKKSIENKQLNEPINFLKKFQNNIKEEKNIVNLGINININPQQQAFQYKDIIELKPSFLDCFIKENHLDEFETKFNQKNISFKKIDDGKYQICSTSKQTLSLFTEYFNQFSTEIIQLDDDSLRALDLSYMQKDQMKQQKIFYRVQNNELHVLSKKNQPSLQKFLRQITSYQGFLFYLLSLEKTNFNERTEYLNLVRARTGYMKIFIKGQQIQEENLVQQIEFREIQEISSFCIIHLIFLRNLNQNQKQECVKQIVNQFQQIFKLLYFLEIKTKPEVAEKLYQKIDKQQIYTTFSQQYNENFISILATKTNYQEIQRQFQQLQFSDEQWKDTEFCIYVEQFCPFINLVQSQDCQQKLKRELEKKGFEVDDTSSIKWIIRPKILSQAVQILQILASKMQDDNNIQIQSANSYQIQKSQSLESLLNENSFYIHQLNQNMLYNPIKIEQIKESPIVPVQPKIEPKPKPKQQNQEEEKEHAKTLLPDSDILNKEKFKSDENSNQSIESESQLNQSISEIQPNSQAEVFQLYNIKQTFEKQCLLVEFQEKLNSIEPPQNEILVQFLKKNFSQIEFQYYSPEVDIDYQNYFSQIATTYTMLYIVQRPDKQYHNEFSKKIIYYLQLDKAIEKFMSHKSLILICFKANKLAHFWVPAKEKQYQICLKDSNQTIPYLWVKRK